MPNPLKNLYNKLFGGLPITNHSYTSSGAGFGLENIFDSYNLKTYQQSLYLYIAVSKIAKRVAGIDLELYKIIGANGDTKEVLDHPLLELLGDPSDLQTRREFFEVSVAHYLLSGDCFWYVSREGNRIESIVPLMPNLVEINLSPDQKRIIGYTYQAGEVYKLAPEDVIHIKNPDPTNLLRGIGVVRPASTRIATEKEANRWQAEWFQNQARPDVIVMTNRAMNKQIADEGRKIWHDTFGRGSGNSNVGFFGSDTKDIKELNKTPKEMDFIETMKFLRDDILASLGVPKAMVTTDDVNLANSKEAYRMFLQEAVVPVMDAFKDALNCKLVPQMDETVFFTFQDPTPADREMKLKETVELKKNGIITANEAREVFDYEVREDGETLASSSNNARIEVQDEAKAVLRTRPLLTKRLRASESVSKALFDLTAPKRRMNSIFTTKEQKQAYAKAVNKRVDRKAETLKEAIDKYHAGLEKRVLASDLSLDGFMNKSEERRIAKDMLGPVVKQLYKDGGQAALNDLFAKSADNFFADEILLAAIAERVNFFTESMTNTTFDALKGVIGAGLKEGLGVDAIGRNIRKEFEDMSVKRARTIAQTETGYTLSKATNDAYNQSSVVTGKEWITVGDEKVRHEHRENDGAVVAKGGTFPNGEEYPAQNSVNCRCTLAPAV